MNTQNVQETHVETPRGRIRYAFDTFEEAQAAGYALWFAHDHKDGSDKPYTLCVASGGGNGVAVRERVSF